MSQKAILTKIPDDLKNYFPEPDSITPAMRQWVTMKCKYKDAILFFQMGDFYETFADDAKICSKELGIALTSRDKKKIPLSGIPLHSLNVHLSRLIKKGYKVAICDQTSEAMPGKGIVDREVVRMITPGTVLETEILEATSNNYLVSITTAAVQGLKRGKKKKPVGLCKTDLSTGEMLVYEFNDFSEKSELWEELLRIQPGEILVTGDIPPLFNKKNPYHDKLTVIEDSFDIEEQKHIFQAQFGRKNLHSFGLKGKNAAQKACAILLKYIQDTQFSAAGHIKKVSCFTEGTFMSLDPATVRNLDLLENSRTRLVKGSLFGAINRCRTAMGARELKKWIIYPLQKLEDIEKRLDRIGILVKDSFLREETSELLKGIYDLERLSSRLSLGHIFPREMLHLARSLKQAVTLVSKISPHFPGFCGDLELSKIEQLTTEIEECIREEPPNNLKSGGLIKPDYNPELKELIELEEQGDRWLEKFEKEEKEKTEIKNLKVKFNQVFGFFIEVPNSSRDKVPQRYQRKQTLTNCERYITTLLKEFEAKAMTAAEKSKELQYQIFQYLRERIATDVALIQECAHLVAGIDVIYSLAETAIKQRYVRPIFSPEKKLAIINGRHPVVEQELLGNAFVPNDSLLQEENEMLGIVTGPNMAGKSTYLRQVALITLLAHMGAYVPANSAIIGICDRIFTRIGASDNLAEGESTFMVEMMEAANILNGATERSLIILDEIGRGTSTFDGLAIAWSIIEYILDGCRARTLFATHYHELIKLPLSHMGAFNLSTAVKDNEDEENIVFLHKVMPGGSDRSYGIHVAKLAGIPGKVLERANEILFQLETQNPSEVQRTRRSLKASQLALFSAERHPVLEELASLNLNQLTPLDALNIINSLKSRLKS
ncbi:DNA mismatch repair protein MutS [Candidatus Riflebacteria bacterium]